MMLVIIVSSFALLLSLILNFLATLISTKTIEDQEKLSPFECGFEPFNSSRLPFSLRFFLIAIIFLIFDVEIAFILPMIMNFSKSNLMMWSSILFSFILVLIVGIIHEWNQGALTWS